MKNVMIWIIVSYRQIVYVGHYKMQPGHHKYELELCRTSVKYELSNNIILVGVNVIDNQVYRLIK